MSYIQSMYGNRDPDFIKGFLAAMDTYAIWHNGKRHIGSPERELLGEMIHAVTELGGKPEDYLDLKPESQQANAAQLHQITHTSD
jgi:hypothetical protein